MAAKVRLLCGIIGIAFFITLAGCSGSGKTDVSVDKDGKKIEIHNKADGQNVDIKVDGNKQTVVIKDGNKTSTVKINKGVDKKRYGDLLYPGAEVKDGGSVEGRGEEAGNFGGAVFITSDSVDKVSAYYKKKMKDAMIMDQRAMTGVITYMKHDKSKITNVSIKKSDEDKGKTEIIITFVEQ